MRLTRKLPSVYLDEHVAPEIAQIFRGYFRAVEIAKTARFKNRDERGYLSELYALNGVFITSDRGFLEWVIRARPKHAGFIYVPTDLTAGTKIEFAEAVAWFLRNVCRYSVTAFRGDVIYPTIDGPHLIRSGQDTLLISWDKLGLEVVR